MRKIRRLVVVVAVVLAVNVPAAAFAGPVTNVCQAVEDQLGKYGWHTAICPPGDPIE